MGRLDSVTKGRFQESEFNGSFSAMNLKSGRSPADPKETLGLNVDDCPNLVMIQSLGLDKFPNLT